MLFRDVVLPEMLESEWSQIRERIHSTIMSTIGPPPDIRHRIIRINIGSVAGLKCWELKLSIIPGTTTNGSVLFPPDGVECNGIGVVCMHGTDVQGAHHGMTDPEVKPGFTYAHELAKIGCITISLDQFGFGEGNKNRPQQEVLEDFSDNFPDWSLDGARLFIHKAAVDILFEICEQQFTKICCIGNSLGGRASLMLAAFDERIRTAIVSAGVSPNVTNIYRNAPSRIALSPILSDAMARNGKPPYEYQQLISLVAPRKILVIEPWNDPYNTFQGASVECFERARKTWELFKQEKGCQLLYHGYGHTTPKPIRDYAYNFIVEEQYCR